MEKPFVFEFINARWQSFPSVWVERLVQIVLYSEILNPLNTLKRGYSITKKDNKVLTSIKNIKKDEMIEVNLSDGIINAKVNEIKEN